jgi:hypothetical protein
VNIPSRTSMLSVALVVVVAISSVALALSRESSSAPWSWGVEGTLQTHPRCSSEGHAQAPDTCEFRVANPPRVPGRVRLEVRVHNPTASTVCYGLSITTSYLAGVQNFCADPHATGKYHSTSPATDYVDFDLVLYVSTDDKNEPLAPVVLKAPSHFSISFSEAGI